MIPTVMRMRLGYSLQLLLLAAALADDHSMESAPAAAPYAGYSSQPSYAMDSICNSTIPLVAPSSGNVTMVEGQQRGHYDLPQCWMYIPYGGPAVAYKLTGTGDVFEATVFQGPHYEQSYLTVYRGCDNASGMLLNGNAVQDSLVTQVQYPYPTPAISTFMSPAGSPINMAPHSYPYPYPTYYTPSPPNWAQPYQYPTYYAPSPPNWAPSYPYPTYYAPTPPYWAPSYYPPPASAPVGSPNLPPSYSNSHCVGEQSSYGARWKSKLGEEYTVIVHGGYSYYNPEPLDFVLSVAASKASSVCGVDNRSVRKLLGQVSGKRKISTVGTTYGKPWFVGDLPSCNYVSSFSPAAIYVVKVSSSNILVKASVQGQGQLSIYKGGCAVGGWKCAATNNYDGSMNGIQQLSWHNRFRGTKYLIVVRSCCDRNALGDHLLTVSASKYGDFCKDVTEANMLNFTDSSTLADKKTFRRLQSCENDCSCHPPRELITPTAFYKFMGTGNTLLATMNEVSNFPSARLALYAVPSCKVTAPVCLASDDYNQRLYWPTVSGETYYLAVYSPTDLSGKHNFTVNINSVTSKDLCSAAVDVGIINKGKSIAISNTTVVAGFITLLPDCGMYGDIKSQALVYSFTAGDAGILSVKDRTPFSMGSSPQVIVLEGPCDRAGCTSRQYGPYYQVEAAKKYFVVVYFWRQTGSFDILLEILKVGNPCADAHVIDDLEDGLEITGSTKNASQYLFNVMGCTPSPNTPSMVYELEMDEDEWITVSVQSDQIRPSAYVLEGYTFQGTCSGEFWCTGGSSYSNGLSWVARAGSTYFVVVSGSEGQTGDFTLQFRVKKKGDACESVVNLGTANKDGRIYSVPIDNATNFYDLPACYYWSGSLPAALYSFNAGITGKMVAMARSATNSYVSLYVYGGSCDYLTCARGGYYDDAFSFNVRRGNVYYIAVSQANVDDGYDSSGKLVFVVLEPVNKGLNSTNTTTVDVCSAIENLGSISENGFVRTGTTKEMPYYSSLENCIETRPSSGMKLYAISTSSRGTVLVTVVGVDVFVSVYQGNCSGALVCIAGSSAYYNRGNVQFDAQSNSVYYVAVIGSDPSVGNFHLRIDFAPAGKLCNHSIPIASIPDAGLSLVGSTENAFAGLSNCSSSDLHRSAAAYSLVVEATNVLRADVSPGLGIAVLSGNCYSATCIGGYADDNSVIWGAEANVTYFIAVFRDQIGNYTLTVKPISASSICDGQGVTNLGKISGGDHLLQGSTINGPIFRDISRCVNDDSRGPWTPSAAYKFTGDGGSYFFSVQSVTGLDPQINAYKGDCGNLECTGNQTYSQDIVVRTEINSTYTVIVNDRNGSGTFEIQIVSAGDVETDAIDITVPESGLFISVSTVDGKLYDLPMCYDFGENGRGVAYRLHTGIGSWTASVTGFSMYAQISAYVVDDEGARVCYGLNDWQKVSWTSDNADQVVYIVVSGSDPSFGGDSALRVRKSKIPVGTMCDGVVDLGPVGVNGVVRQVDPSFVGNSTLTMRNCSYGPYFPSGGVSPALYTVQGTGAQLTASVFAPFSDYSAVSVIPLTGSCGAFECVSGEVSQFYRSVSWTGEAGRTYFIMVQICCSQATFVLTVHGLSAPTILRGHAASQEEGNLDYEARPWGVDGPSTNSPSRFKNVESVTTRSEQVATGPSSSSSAVSRLRYIGHLIGYTGVYFLF